MQQCGVLRIDRVAAPPGVGDLEHVRTVSATHEVVAVLVAAELADLSVKAEHVAGELAALVRVDGGPRGHREVVVAGGRREAGHGSQVLDREVGDGSCGAARVGTRIGTRVLHVPQAFGFTGRGCARRRHGRPTPRR